MPSHANITVGLEERMDNSMLATASGLTASASFDEDVTVDKLEEHDVKVDGNTTTCYIEGRFQKTFGINVLIKVPAVPRGIPRKFAPPFHHISCMIDNIHSGPGRLARE
jgi:hypothetical protein